MIKVAMVKSNGEVGYTISPAVDEQYIDGQEYGDYTARHIPADSSDNNYIFEKYWDEGWQSKEVRPSEWHDWQNGIWVLNAIWLLRAIRIERVKLLSISDWTQFPDSPLSNAKKAEWTTYRQALRDIPETYSDATSLDDIIWPTKPEV